MKHSDRKAYFVNSPNAHIVHIMNSIYATLFERVFFLSFFGVYIGQASLKQT